MVIPVLSLVVIFLFSIQKFSKHIHEIADGRFKKILGQATATPLRGIGIGAAFAALIHSSTATTVILAGLANAGLISFGNSLGVIFGANIGTTITSQLIALKLTAVAPYIVLVGFLMAFLGGRYKSWGKTIFYFGLVFFSLSLISLYISPLQSDPYFMRIVASVDGPLSALVVGLVFTAIIQSSTVTSGLAVLFVAGGILNFDQALGIILGANLGTTATVLLASIVMNKEAKKVAVAHFLFNFLGILIFLPFYSEFSSFIKSFSVSAEQQVAMAHMVFNLACAAIFLVLTKPFGKIVSLVVEGYSRGHGNKKALSQ